MLTRLELVGFKSFADKTRIDFAPGITAVVGPNGSGKSNVVDAVKWILGEQSAKSLRGGEMADVIFNGSSARKSLGMAEVSITFDNARRMLAFDAAEVQVTRRVYRDGQGEYLINGSPVRLKDVKDLFLGSGIGTTAYSILEQGRVDALLTASAGERRAILEEAAGVSRFKVKKLEALKKLDRVQADLTRVRDILAELEKNLRTLSAQASKARKYQEYHGRLKTLRLAAAAADYADVTAALEAAEADRTRAAAAVAAADAAAGDDDAAGRKIEWDAARCDDALRTQDRKLADAARAAAAAEATAAAARDQAAAADAERLRLGTQRLALAVRVRAVETEARAAADAAAAAKAEAEAAAFAAAAADTALAEATAAAAAIADETRLDRDRQFDLVGRAAPAQSAAAAAKTAAERLTAEADRKRAAATRTAAEAEALARAVADLTRDDDRTRAGLAAARAEADRLRAEQAALRAAADELRPTLDSLRDRRSDLRGRAELLEEWERTRDGFGAGVRDAIATLAGSPLAGVVRGPVADLLHAPRAVAAAVDLALGELAQAFVVLDPARMDEVAAAFASSAGRVTLVPLTATTPADGSLAGVVTCDVLGLADRLLGTVILAESPRPGVRVVSAAGELFEPDGTRTVGPLDSGRGLLSRKSELAELRAQAAELDAEIGRLTAERSAALARADALDAPAAGKAAEAEALAGESGGLRDRLTAAREKRTQLADMAELLAAEAEHLNAERTRAAEAAATADAEAADAETTAAAVAARLAAAAAAAETAAARTAAAQADQTAARVAAGRGRERAASTAARAAELANEVRQRKIDAVNLNAADREARGRQTDAVLAALRATQAAAVAYAEKDDRGRRVNTLAAEKAVLEVARAARRTTRAAADAARAAARDDAHRYDLAAADLRGRRDALISRVRDEYAVDVAALPADAVVPADSPDGPETEADLRQKIARLGGVNLEALEQLADAEAREKDYRGRHDDLAAAGKSLLDVIEQVNGDTRKLFGETLAAVRGHFQELFRKLFGGGTADVVPEDANDLLEGGIEIVARPPGKEPRSLAQLSGGEKTLTAVALLLAIFRSKPGPFCLLDEVDAALDEANAVRLAGLLQEFKDRTQFIVITHKKRTMAAADVLHGITMAEGGVSRRVGVRFEDWPDDDRQTARAA